MVLLTHVRRRLEYDANWTLKTARLLLIHQGLVLDSLFLLVANGEVVAASHSR